MGQAVGAILGGVAGSMNAFGQLQAGEAAARAMRFNRDKSKIQMRLSDERSRKNESRTRGINITKIAKAGVRRTGSPAEVLTENAFQAERGRFLRVKAAQLQQDLLTFQADSTILTSTLTSISNTISSGAPLAGAFSSGGAAPAGDTPGGGGGGGGQPTITFGGSDGSVRTLTSSSGRVSTTLRNPNFRSSRVR